LGRFADIGRRPNHAGPDNRRVAQRSGSLPTPHRRRPPRERALMPRFFAGFCSLRCHQQHHWRQAGAARTNAAR